MNLDWLPEAPLATHDLHRLPELPAGEAARSLRTLATRRLELPSLLKLDRAVARLLSQHGGRLPGLQPLRLAILASSTSTHLLPGIRVAGLRHGLALEIYETPYNAYRQELETGNSGLHGFSPQAILFALDAHHLVATGSPSAALDLVRSCWHLARRRFSAQVLQQAALPVLPALLGNQEERLPSSPAAILAAFNELLRPAAAEAGVEVFSLDRLALHHGLHAWHDPALWYRARQEIHPAAAALYGDGVVRLLGATRGHSARALVLDLDGTLWAGVLGDDGLHGIVLGQGSAVGEAHLALQAYALALKNRGIPLVVCSKNDEATALEAFTHHPEMLLRREDIAVFIANWSDKATNLREIARRLNLGLGALVFVDDNPAERELIRRELPEVHVPELPGDPALFVPTLAAAGYFEAACLTAEDAGRAASYAALDPLRFLGDTHETSSTDLTGYLESLEMTLTAQPVDELSLRRATQLFNKTNQFNLTTRRLSEAELRAAALGPGASSWITLTCRLTDRLADHGLIAVLAARLRGTGPGREAVIEDWLMSCRVLGRHVEDACLNLLADRARAAGARRLLGLYRPTAKNSQVRSLYPRLGFTPLERGCADEFLTSAGTHDETAGDACWQLDLATFHPLPVPLRWNVVVPAETL